MLAATWTHARTCEHRRLIIVLVAVAAVVIVMLVTGLADDKAPPGSGGRVPVPQTGTDDSR